MWLLQAALALTYGNGAKAALPKLHLKRTKAGTISWECVIKLFSASVQYSNSEDAEEV